MASTHRAPKQWCLSKIETVNSFENWKQNLLYTLSLDRHFAPYLEQGVEWLKKTRTAPNRGFTDDGEAIAEADRRTSQQKVHTLELMLGQIANYCPVISRNTIVKNSTSIDQIWQTIRLHYGFQTTGAHLIDFASIRYQPDERPEDLYQRLMAFVEDNLLRRDIGITHHGEAITEDEELTPSLENFIVLTWLQLIHSELPKLVKQRYGTELRSRTLASIKPEISQALDSLLDEIRSSEDAKVMRAATSNFTKPKSKFVQEDKLKLQYNRNFKSCPLCKEAGRPDRHFLSKCTYLPISDKKFMVKARQAGVLDDSDEEIPNIENDSSFSISTVVNRVQVRQSPYVDVFFSFHNVRLTIDSGATGNMMRASTAKQLGVKVSSSTQSAHQADGSSPLKVLGEVHISFTRDGHNLYFEGLVVENLDVDILAGIPFMEKNDISIRPAKRQVVIGNNAVYIYGSNSQPQEHHSVRRALILRAPNNTTTIWPGEYLELQLPSEFGTSDDTFAVEPRPDQKGNRTDLRKDSKTWPPPGIVSSIAGKIRIPNETHDPQTVRKNEHICQIRSTSILQRNDYNTSKPCPNVNSTYCQQNFSDTVQIDPDNF